MPKNVVYLSLSKIKEHKKPCIIFLPTEINNNKHIYNLFGINDVDLALITFSDEEYKKLIDPRNIYEFRFFTDHILPAEKSEYLKFQNKSTTVINIHQNKNKTLYEPE